MYGGLLCANRHFKNFFGEYPVIAGSLRLTNACPLKCPHCYTNGGKALKDEIATKEIKSVLDQFADLKSFYMFFTGGEPFLRKDLVDILSYTDKLGIGISLSTSGVGVKPEILKKSNT